MNISEVVPKLEKGVSSCPFCVNQFKNTLENGEIKVLDIAELIRRAI